MGASSQLPCREARLAARTRRSCTPTSPSTEVAAHMAATAPQLQAMPSLLAGQAPRLEGPIRLQSQSKAFEQAVLQVSSRIHSGALMPTQASSAMQQGQQEQRPLPNVHETSVMGTEHAAKRGRTCRLRRPYARASSCGWRQHLRHRQRLQINCNMNRVIMPRGHARCEMHHSDNYVGGIRWPPAGF